MGIRKPPPTDIDPLPHRWRNLPPLTGLRSGQVLTVCRPRRWPGNRNDVILARHTLARLLTSHHQILGDGGYRAINAISTPRHDHTGRNIRNGYYRAPPRVQAGVEHLIAPLNHWQVPRQFRRRGRTINHSLQTIARLRNLKTHKQLRANS
jgi:hypothetical protein